MDEEQKQEEVLEEVKEEVVQEEVKEEAKPEVKEDRPERNWKAEIDRKNREMEKLRADLEAEKARQVHRFDPNDISTWGENDLKAVANSSDPAHLRFKDQAQDILLERKLERMRANEAAKEKRVKSELELRKSYPEALDPSSEFSTRMEEVMYELDLDKSPAGRLAAAKLVSAEIQRAKDKAGAGGRKTEEIRQRSVKAQYSEGDRPKPEFVEDKKAQEDLYKRAAAGDDLALAKLLKQRGQLPKLGS